jgi:hypothetical protein
MIVAAREFKSGAEMLAAAAEVHARCFNPKAPPVIKTKPAPVVETPVQPRKMVIPESYLRGIGPMWKREVICFDAHVKVWQWQRAETAASKLRGFISAKCDELGTTFEALQTSKKNAKIVYARHLIWFELRAKFGASYPQLGRMFGGRDHTTIYHGVAKMEKFMAFVEANGVPEGRPIHMVYARRTWA